MVAASDKCKRCRADILWLRTTKGAWMPVDAGTAQKGEIFDAKKGHMPHWATCPHAKEFRKKNPEPPAIPEPRAETEEQALIRRCREKGIIK